jgi:peptide/nickel transport system permease protein
VEQQPAVSSAISEPGATSPAGRRPEGFALRGLHIHHSVLARRILNRLGIGILVLLGVSIINFALLNAAPGSPVNTLVNPLAGPGVRHQVEVELGLNKPLPVQYLTWLQEALHGNLGYSYVTNQPVTEVIASHIGATAELVVPAFIIAYALGILLGVLSSLRPYSKIDVSATFAGILGISIPGFILGLIAIYVFALRLHWFPTGGQLTAGVPFSLPDLISHMVLPVFSLAVFDLAVVTRYTRSGMLEVLTQDYVRTAVGKGLPHRVVIVRHALRNALGPLVTLGGLSLPRLIGGAVVIEVVFQWPGMGQLAINSVLARDYPVLLGLNLIFAFLVIVGNLIADILYTVIDPRVAA